MKGFQIPQGMKAIAVVTWGRGKEVLAVKSKVR